MDDEKRNPREGRGEGDAVCQDSANPTTATAGQESFDRITPIAALLARLSAAFPVLAEFRPLALRIALPPCDATRGATDEQRCRALIEHCSGERYLRGVVAGVSRFDLNGKPCGVVSEIQRRAAQRRLEVLARTAKRRAARLRRRS